jgi:hypothetical protein
LCNRIQQKNKKEDKKKKLLGFFNVEPDVVAIGISQSSDLYPQWTFHCCQILAENVQWSLVSIQKVVWAFGRLSQERGLNGWQSYQQASLQQHKWQRKVLQLVPRKKEGEILVCFLTGG